MTVHASAVRDLPDYLLERLAGRRPAVFLDYDGLLAPVVDRPEDAVISKGMRTTVRALDPALPNVRYQRARPSRRPYMDCIRADRHQNVTRNGDVLTFRAVLHTA